jgi:hypothetical protein
MRTAIGQGTFDAFRAAFHADYRVVLEEHTLNVKENN